MSSLEESTSIVQLKLRLPSISPMIWRRVLVPASVTLREPHDILQVSMGWEGVHLYYFDIHAVRTTAPSSCLPKARTYLSPGSGNDGRREPRTGDRKNQLESPDRGIPGQCAVPCRAAKQLGRREGNQGARTSGA